MIRSLLEVNPVQAGAHTGFGWDGPLRNVHETNGGTVALHVEQPLVNWDRIGRDRYTRRMAVSLAVIDSIGRQEFFLERTDTLSREQTRLARRESKPPLRGDNPFFWSRYGWPATAILGGVAVVSLLFFIRS